LVWNSKGSGGKNGGKYYAKVWSIKGSPFFMTMKLAVFKSTGKYTWRTPYQLRTNIKGRGF